MNIDKLIIYRGIKEEPIMLNMQILMRTTNGNVDMQELSYETIYELMKVSNTYGFYGNLWHTYLTYLLVNNENSYSKSCEIKGKAEGSVNEIVLHDMKIILELFQYDLDQLQDRFEVEAFNFLKQYKCETNTKKLFNKRIRDRICNLAEELGKVKTEEALLDVLTGFYKECGVGKLGLHKAFRVEEREIIPITNITHVQLDDLVGYDIPKQKLIDNTEAFVGGRKANNCLLFGDAGTGKSTCVKAILNQYYDQGLRIIEIYKHQFQDLNDIITQIKNRNYKFVIFMDDLSFEEFEIEYKYLKAVIEGGLEKKPDNVLIYATSNRRHLVREEFADKIGRRDDLHASDTVQEKLSLAARFGVSIFFNGPSKKEFNQIVIALANRNGIEMEEAELLLEANKWEVSHGGKSGRTAQQFIDYLLGKIK